MQYRPDISEKEVTCWSQKRGGGERERDKSTIAKKPFQCRLGDVLVGAVRTQAAILLQIIFRDTNSRDFKESLTQRDINQRQVVGRQRMSR